jgi:hypothetical protein
MIRDSPVAASLSCCAGDAGASRALCPALFSLPLERNPRKRFPRIRVTIRGAAGMARADHDGCHLVAQINDRR